MPFAESAAASSALAGKFFANFVAAFFGEDAAILAHILPTAYSCSFFPENRGFAKCIRRPARDPPVIPRKTSRSRRQSTHCDDLVPLSVRPTPSPLLSPKNCPYTKIYATPYSSHYRALILTQWRVACNKKSDRVSHRPRPNSHNFPTLYSVNINNPYHAIPKCRPKK